MKIGTCSVLMITGAAGECEEAAMVAAACLGFILAAKRV